MDTLLLIIRLLVAVVFGVAGIAKLFDLPGSVAAVEGFGVPQRISRLVGSGLPIVEIAIAYGLLAVTTAPLAAIAGTTLMSLFVIAIAYNLAKGKTPECHCFGKLHSAPIGKETLARNAAIGLGAAIVAVAGPGIGLVPWLQRLDATSQVLLVFLLVALSVIGWQWKSMAGLSATASAMLDRITTIEGIVSGDSPSDVPGPAVGKAAPGFLLNAVGKGMVSLENLKALGKPVLLVFAEPTCSVCTAMMPKLGRWRQELADVLTVAVISTGTEEANRRKVDRYGLEWVLLQERREATMTYRTPGTPSAVLIDRAGNVVAPLVYGPDPILGMLQEIADATGATPAEPRTQRPAQPASTSMHLHPAAGAD